MQSKRKQNPLSARRGDQRNAPKMLRILRWLAGAACVSHVGDLHA